MDDHSIVDHSFCADVTRELTKQLRKTEHLVVGLVIVELITLVALWVKP